MERYEGLFDVASEVGTQTEAAHRLRAASSDASTSTQAIECSSVAIETEDDQEEAAAEQRQEALDALDRSWREKFELQAEEGRRTLEEVRAALREEQLSREEAQGALKEARAALALEGPLGQVEALRAQNAALELDRERLERSASVDAERLAETEQSREQLVHAVAEARQQAAEMQNERDGLRVERNTSVQSLEAAISRVQLLESEVAQLAAAAHAEAEARAQQQRLNDSLQARVDALEAKLRHAGEQLKEFAQAMGLVEPWAVYSGAAGGGAAATT